MTQLTNRIACRIAEERGAGVHGSCPVKLTCSWVASAGPPQSSRQLQSLGCCMQDKPEELRSQLEELLQKEGIQYSYSATSKFANFINKTLV